GGPSLGNGSQTPETEDKFSTSGDPDKGRCPSQRAVHTEIPVRSKE
ncbi:hypothetical protein A2U01_0105164, partial [Trifolium medium]|nr:hypothetical protein [Trifolium medium]